MRRIVSLFVVVLVAAGCGDVVGDAPPEASARLLIRESPSPYQHVSAGYVTAVIPDAWHPRPAGDSDDLRHGIVAAPTADAWRADRPPAEGLAAMWVDGTEVGVPSDYYYLVATGTALEVITGSKRCTATRRQVIVDHSPAYADGAPDSPGDFVARGHGTCIVRDELTRWAYFVAAPGYGPVREVGIPSSGLYVVVAVMPEAPRASFELSWILERTEFDGASVTEMIAAARAATMPVLGPL